MKQDDSFISFNRLGILQRFPDNVVGDPEAMFLVVAETSLGDAARDALDKTAARLEWDRGATYLFADAPLLLTKVDLFEAIEGLDPSCLVIAGAAVCGLASLAYGQEIPSCKHFRLFGRDACAFDNLDALLASDEGRKTAWATLRALPRASR